MSMPGKLFVGASVFSLLLLTRLWGQIGGGSIVGSVLDSSGAAVIKAKVTATNSGTNETSETLTNDEGYFEFPLLPAGRYLLQAQAPGFQTAKTAEFSLNTGTRPRFDLKLTIGPATESIQVDAAAPIVNATTTDLGVVMETREVAALPLNGRDFQQLVGLQPGAQAAPITDVGKRGGMEFNGSSAWGNNLLLDGVDMTFGENPSSASDKAAGTEVGRAAGNATGNGLGRGSLINTVSVEAIQEFKTTSSAYSAEYGRATGGVLNITTKSGTNQFHGTLFEFFRNDLLDANSFFSNLNGFPKPPLRWNQYGANLGGPIKRDKLFFFVNYEGAQAKQSETLSGPVPTALLLSKLTPALRQNLQLLPASNSPTADPLVGFNFHNDSRTNDENTFVTREDIQLGIHRLALRYNYNHQDFTTPNLIATSPSTFPTRFHNAAIEEVSTLSPTMVNEVRLGFNRTDLFRHDAQALAVPAFVYENSTGINTGMDKLHFTGDTYTLADNFSVIRGRQTIKTGFEIRNVRTYRDEFLPPSNFYNTIDDLIANKTDAVGVFFGAAKRLWNTDFGIFVQDDWRISKRFQVNAGLRWEYFTPFRGAYNVNTPNPFGPFGKKGGDMWRPYHRDFGPRFGIVYDAFGNQKLIIRAGGALLYTPPVMQLNYDLSYADPRLPFFATFLPSDLPPGTSLTFPFDQSFFAPYVANPASIPPDLVTGRRIVDYKRRDEKSGQWNLSVQYALTPNRSVQASYVGNRGLNLYSTRNLNLFDPNLNDRPHPDFGDVNYSEYAGRSSYHALQLSFNQRLQRGLTLNLYYTFAKALTYYGADGNIGLDYSVQDPNNIAASRGPKNSDIRNSETLIASYALPTPSFAANSALKKTLLDGWNIEAIQTARSGLPINVFAGVDLVGTQITTGTRPDLVPQVDPYVRNMSTLQWLNPAAFDIQTPQANHRYGNLGYNALRGPSALTFDFALHKAFHIRERQQVTFRAEAFNLLNHPVFNLPDNTVSSPSFGQITSASDGRNVQLALKYIF